MKKKFFALLLCAVVVLGMLTGCGGNTESETTAKATDSKASETTAKADVTTEAEEEDPFAEHVSLTYASTITGRETNDRDNEFHQFFADKFNIDLEYIDQSWGEASEQMNTWMYAGDLPTYSKWSFTNSSQVASAVEQELLKKWPDDWKTRYPNLAATYANSEANAYYEETFGGTYLYCVPIYAENYPAETLTDHPVVGISRNYAEQAGVDLSKYEESLQMTISELEEIMRAIKESGVVEYPLSTDGSVTALLARVSDNSTSGFYKDEDGTYKWAPAEESSGIKAALETFHRWYVDGLLDADFYNNATAAQAGMLLEAETIAVANMTGAVQNLASWATQMEQATGKDVEEEILYVNLTDDDGVLHNPAMPNYWRAIIIAPEATDAQVERVLAILDYLSTSEGQAIGNLGLKDVDWEYDSDGNFVSLLPEGTTLYNKYNTLNPYSECTMCADDFAFVNPNYTEYAKSLAAKLFQVRDTITNNKDKEYDWFLASYTSDTMTQASLIYSDEYTKLIIKDGDFDSNYDAWVAEKMSVIQPVLDELNGK